MLSIESLLTPKGFSEALKAHHKNLHANHNFPPLTGVKPVHCFAALFNCNSAEQFENLLAQAIASKANQQSQPTEANIQFYSPTSQLIQSLYAKLQGDKNAEPVTKYIDSNWDFMNFYAKLKSESNPDDFYCGNVTLAKDERGDIAITYTSDDEDNGTDSTIELNDNEILTIRNRITFVQGYLNKLIKERQLKIKTYISDDIEDRCLKAGYGVDAVNNCYLMGDKSELSFDSKDDALTHCFEHMLKNKHKNNPCM